MTGERIPFLNIQLPTLKIQRLSLGEVAASIRRNALPLAALGEAAVGTHLALSGRLDAAAVCFGLEIITLPVAAVKEKFDDLRLSRPS